MTFGQTIETVTAAGKLSRCYQADDQFHSNFHLTVKENQGIFGYSLPILYHQNLT